MPRKKSEKPKQSPDALNELFCASCGREVFLSEMTDGSARQFAGKVYCSNCLNANARVEATKCRKCGAYERPVYDGKALLCRKCGAELSTRSGRTAGRAGARKTALKVCPECSGIVGVGATLCGHCGEPLTRSARKAIRRQASAGPFFAALVAMLAVMILLLVGAACLFEVGPWKPIADDSAIKDINDKLEGTQARVTLAEKALAELRTNVAPEDIALKSDMDTRFAAVEALIKAKPDINPAKLQAIERRLAELTAAVEAVKKLNPPAGMTPDEGANAARDAVNDIDGPPGKAPDPEPNAEDRKEEIRRMDRDFDILRKEADALVQGLRYGDAIAKWNSRPEYRAASWQARREKQKKLIRDIAMAKFNGDRTRADQLTVQGRAQDAIAIYKRAAAYGLPQISDICDARIAALRRTGPAKTVAPETARLIAVLTNVRSAQHERADAVKRLGELGDRAAIPALVNALDDPDWYVRNLATQALGDMRELSAVPKLINNLTHIILPVRARSVEALKQITGQDYGHDKARWLAWWQANGTKLLTAPKPRANAPAPANIPNAFASTVVVYSPDEKKIVFTHRRGDKLVKGDNVWLYKGGKRLCVIIVVDVGSMHAVGRVKGLQDGDTVEKGDSVMIGARK